MADQATLNKQEFKELRKASLLAGPSAVLFLMSLLCIITAWYLSLNGTISLTSGCAINGFSAYIIFSIAHDSTHRALSSKLWLNDGMGSVALLFLVPFAPMSVVRWMHIQHHRFTNDKMDPDRFIHSSPLWQAPVRWANFDLYYVYYFVRYGGKIARKSYLKIAMFLVVLIGLLTVGISAGYGLQILFLWFLPSRIALFLVAIVFVILPLYPGTVTHAENPYLATTMRLGSEWLITPLFAYHNYHLIHHLYPTIPFYKMARAWHLKKAELMKHDVSIQKPFSLNPENIDVHRAFRSEQGDRK